MKFQLTDEYLYWWPVTIEIPHPENSGQFQKQQLEIQFEALPDEELQALDEEYRAITEPAERAKHEHAQLLRVCKDWRGVVEPDGKSEVEFTEENLRSAIRFPFFRIGVYRALSKSQAGSAARKGN